MRRILAAIVCLLLLTCPVLAASQITSAKNLTTISPDGSCQVSVNLTVRTDGPVEDLVFPIPGDATSISLNGKTVRPSRSGLVKNISLSGIVGSAAGEYPLSISYSLSHLVTTEPDGRLFLELPLLNGFAYPVSRLEFTITLPSDVTLRPSFSSGYHQESIESDLVFTVKGAVISGYVKTQLKDHETLSMRLEVPAEQFGGIHVKTAATPVTTILAIILAGLTLVYWLIALRCLPSLPIRWPNCPEGLTAGDLGSHLTAVPRDFTAMVISWAQLGYLLIQTDENGRVLLHKRMEMDNERSETEIRLFHRLFGKRRMVEGTGYHYALVYRKATKLAPGIRELYTRQSGSPLIFRLLALSVSLCLGLSMGGSLPESTFWSIFLGLVVGILAAVSSWFLQNGCYYLHLRQKSPRRLALALCGMWLLFGLVTKQAGPALGLIFSQLAAGFAAAYGGRRSDMGHQQLQQILGLRRYLRKLNAKQLHKLLKSNPEYFYQIAPCALALGVEKALMRHCGKVVLPSCSFLVGSVGGRMTVSEWLLLLQDTAEAMDERFQQLRGSGKR